jgi:hypothetical protein
MKRSYQVAVDKQTGMPVAEIAHSDTWELVEYLSYQRAAVFYSHCEKHLIVRFPNLNPASAQQLLCEWARATFCEYESPGDRSK